MEDLFQEIADRGCFPGPLWQLSDHCPSAPFAININMVHGVRMVMPVNYIHGVPCIGCLPLLGSQNAMLFSPRPDSALDRIYYLARKGGEV